MYHGFDHNNTDDFEELKSIYNEFKIHQLFNILIKIPNVIKSAYHRTNISADIKLIHLVHIQNALFDVLENSYWNNLHKVRYRGLLRSHYVSFSCLLSVLSNDMLISYIMDDPNFNAQIIYFHFALKYLIKFPTTSLHSTSNITITKIWKYNKWRKFIDNFPIILYDLDRHIPFIKTAGNIVLGVGICIN